MESRIYSTETSHALMECIKGGRGCRRKEEEGGRRKRKEEEDDQASLEIKREGPCGIG